MKLRKLILWGFKSFADRTELDFHDGISCIVGPNGCGKSNIVDAFKWVLGEQSAKSLRGSEMADVIFNGSSTRRPAGMAEVTLVFDNSSGLLRPGLNEGQQAAEVCVTRRLYRSGQSEYLINKTPCRLKDIREMFMDTGLGRDAYSVIEQGKVEMFLQAGHEDRRAIFDEAAGISKYKARKKEALRKLERVEQNLLRVNDILAEVEKRLRSIKYQAGKARSYQAFTERLKELRSLHFLAQYHKLSAHRRALQQAADQAADRLASINTRIDQLQASQSATEIEAVDLERSSRELQGKLASVCTQIATCQERAQMLEARSQELAEQIARAEGHCRSLQDDLGKLRMQAQERKDQLASVEALCTQLQQGQEALSAEYSAGELAVVHLQARLEDEKAGTIDLLRRTAQLHNEISALDIRRENLRSQRTRLAGRAQEIDQSLSQALTQKAKAQARLDDINELLRQAQDRLEQTRQAERLLEDRQHTLVSELSQAREQRSAIISRMEALQEMQQRLEGVGQGARLVLDARAKGRLKAVRGMLGEFLETDVQHAPMIEAALAGADQLLLADSFDSLAAESDELARVLGDSGSVEILCLDRLPPMQSDFDAACCRGVLGRAIDWARFESFLAPAAWRLLGRTLVVRDLIDAAAASAAAPAGFRFVTLAGEVLEADGRLRVGSAKGSAGLISRRSELAKLQAEKQDLDGCIAELEKSCRQARDQHEHNEALLQSLRTAIYEANTERVESESLLTQLNGRIEGFQREQPLIAGDLKDLADEIERSVQAEHQAKQKAAELEALNAERQREIEAINERLAGARVRQAELAGRITELKVSLAQAGEKKHAISQSLSELDRRCRQLEQELAGAAAEMEANRLKRQDAQTGIVRAQEETERLLSQRQELDRLVEEAEETRRGLAEKLQQIREHLSEQRKAQEQASAAHAGARLELGEADVRIESVISRAAEEMGMNLPELHASYQHDEGRDWSAVEAEIQDLRGKIERLGNVNLDAIAEQDQLQQRQQFLATQLADVKSSQEQLTELIRRINRESRQMFLDCFQQIRQNFRELFRKLFGGGRADIFLLDENDVLETGIEVVAQPPGKDLRGITLLSGGEKTMTALALLFSIFKSRPSPFCLLDEVDAALDEANNERFNRLVGEFVSHSQIVIISHAKRTMSASDILYGVTMQEPGVSKRISVRFEEAGKSPQRQLEAISA